MVEREPLEVCENYTIERNDTLRIESNGIITNIFINNKKIQFVTKLELLQEAGECMKIKIKRLFTDEDYERIKQYF